MISREPRMILVRRERVMRLTGLGWYAREIAREIGVTLRTVQRYQRAERNGVPTGWPPR